MQLLAQAAENPLASYCPTTEPSSFEVPRIIECVIEPSFLILKIDIAYLIFIGAPLSTLILTRVLLLLVCWYLSYDDTLLVFPELLNTVLL